MKIHLAVPIGTGFPLKKRAKSVGVIGNRIGITDEIVFDKLDELYKNENIVVVSGKARGVDESAEFWAYRRGKDFTGFEPTEQTKKAFFSRNGLIALVSEEITAFITRGRMRAGTWNCIKQFLDMNKSNFTVYDQDGNKWQEKDYPPFILSRLMKVRRMQAK